LSTVIFSFFEELCATMQTGNDCANGLTRFQVTRLYQLVKLIDKAVQN